MKHKIYLLYIGFLVLILKMLSIPNAFSQTPGIWETWGPYGDNPNFEILFADPKNDHTIYAGTSERGVYRSTDLGVTWQQANSPMADKWVMSLTIFRDTVYAGTSGSGVYKSSDGINWFQMKSPYTSWSVSVLFKVDEVLFAGSSQGVYKTIDGHNWQPLKNGIGSKHITTIIFVDGALYVGTMSDGVFKSTTGGESWTQADQPMNDKKVNSLIYYNGALYAGTGEYQGVNDGIFKSYNGKTWYQKKTDIWIWKLTTVGNVLFAGTNSNGVWRSEDNGNSWKSTNNTLDGKSVENIFSFNNLIYACATNGLFFSTNLGDNWFPDKEPIKSMTVNSMIELQGNLFAGTVLGIFRKPDLDRNWINSSINLGLVDVDGLVTELESTILYSYSQHRGGLFRSVNGGHNWVKLDEPFPVQTVYVEKDVIYVGGSLWGISYSLDGGKKWTESIGDIKGKNVSKIVPKNGKFYAATKTGIYKSLNGVNWTQTPNQPLNGKEVTSLIILDQTMCAGTYDTGIFWSDDEGDTWHPSSGEISSNDRITCFEHIGNTLFAGTGRMTTNYGNNHGVFWSNDGGKYWYQANYPMKNKNVNTIKSSDGKLLVGTFDEGIFYSLDGKTNWVHARAPMDDERVSCMISIDGILYTGTSSFLGPNSGSLTYKNAGIFRSIDGGYNWTPLRFGMGTRDIKDLNYLPNLKLLYASTDNGVYLQDLDFESPRADSVKINLGSSFTKINKVSVISFVDNADSMNFSDSPIFNEKKWLLYSVDTTFVFFSSGDGRKTIYALFKDISYNFSDTLQASIILDTQPPSKPKIISADLIPKNQRMLKWERAQDVYGLTEYRVKIREEDPDLSNTPYDIVSPNDTTKTIFEKKVKWYWQVIAVDNAGNESASDIMEVDSKKLLAPEISTDLDSSIINYTTPIIEWMKNDTAACYIIEWATDNNFKIPFRNTTKYTADTLTTELNGNWFVRVKAINHFQVEGEWSITISFEVDTKTPNPLQLAIENNSKFANKDSVTLSFDVVDAVLAEDSVAFSNNGTFDDSTWEVYGSKEKQNWPLSRGNDGVRTVYIQLKDRAGNYSTVRSDSIILDQTPPHPRPVLESANLIFEAGKPFRKLKWTSARDNYGLKEYRIEISEQEQPDFSNSRTGNIVLPTDTMKIIPEKTMKWHWRVIAVDTAGNETISDTLEVDSHRFSKPQILGDINSIINDTNPTLRWSKNDTASYYEIQWAMNNKFLSSRDTTTQDTTIRIKVENDGTWFVRVRAFNNFQVCTDWSDPYLEFVVDTETPNPLDLSIENNSEFTNKDSVDLKFYVEKIGDKDSVRFSNDNTFTISSWEPYTANKREKWQLARGNDGVRTVYIQLKDRAGNFSKSISASIILDQTPPTPPKLLPPEVRITQKGDTTKAECILSWQKSTDLTSGVSTYSIQFSQKTNFSEPINKLVPLDTSLEKITYRYEGLGNGLWYWRVIAGDRAGNNTKSFDSTYSFKIDLKPPDAPGEITGPGITNNPQPAFSWAKIEDAIAYIIHYANNADFIAPSIDSIKANADSVTYQLRTKLSDGEWYLKAKSRNSSGLESGWSGTIRFTIDTVAPDDNILQINYDSTYVNRLSVTLTYNARGANSVRFSNTTNFNNISWELFADKQRSWNLADGPDGARKVYVEFKDQAGNISTVASDSIILDRTAPSIPEIDTVIITSQNKRILRWKPSNDITSGIKAYHLLIMDKEDSLQHTVKGDSVQYAKNLYDQKWYWQVRAADHAGNKSLYSAIDSFSVVDQKPDIPMVTIDSTITNNNKPTITWTKSERAKTYSLQYDISPNFINPQTIPELTTTCYTFTQGLADGKYYFRTFAKNMAGVSSDTSASATLTIDTQPPSDVKINIAFGARFTRSDSVTIHLSAIGANWVKLSGDFMDDESKQYKQFGPFDIAQNVRTQFLVKLYPGDGVKNLQVVFKDSAGNIAETNRSVFLDTQQPVFTSFSPVISDTLPAVNRSITINFNSPLEEGSGIKSFRLLCRRTGDPADAILPLRFQNEIVEIPDFMVTNRGIDYQIITEDSAGNQSILQNSSPDGTLDFFSIPVKIGTREAGSSEGLPGGGDGAAYRLVSLPLMTAGIKASDAFTNLGDYGEKKDYRIWRYQGNRLWQEGANLILQPGESYFLIKRKSGPLSNNCPGTSTRGSDAALGKINGWQLRGNGDWTMVGNPFNFDIPLAQLWLKNNDSCIVSSSNMDLWSYIGSEDSSGWTRDFEYLEKWSGIAVRNAGEADVMIYKPPYYDTPLPISLPKKQAIEDWLARFEGEDIKAWMVQIKARGGNYHDNENYFGACELAKAGNDCFDSYEPPLLPDGLSLFFTEQNGDRKCSLASDIRPLNSEGNEWQVNIISGSRSCATLRFDKLESLPEDYEIYLIDQTAKILRDLRQQKMFEVYIPQSPQTKSFKILVGDKDFVDEHSDGLSIIPDKFALHQNYPNPFNKSTVIRYSLPTPGRVNFRIYNLMGREILKIEDKKDRSPGHYEMVFDFANYASGVYFYQVSIRGKKNYNAVKKMIFVK